MILLDKLAFSTRGYWRQKVSGEFEGFEKLWIQTYCLLFRDAKFIQKPTQGRIQGVAARAGSPSPMEADAPALRPKAQGR